MQRKEVGHGLFDLFWVGGELKGSVNRKPWGSRQAKGVSHGFLTSLRRKDKKP